MKAAERKALVAKFVESGFEPEVAIKMLATSLGVQEQIHNMRVEALQQVMKKIPDTKAAMNVTAVILHLEMEDTQYLMRKFVETVA